ncbi:MAG: pilus assembly protein PilM [Candidatus Omnitrophica bacterium]|nr:pilus assembly protein PilM [Candidatus Omnitrophota bacterium]
MSHSSRIGIFLSDDKVVVVESDRNKPQKIISAPLASSTESPFRSDITDEIQTVALLQKLFRENKISLGPACVSIPLKEVILRSFVIPWMPAYELNNGVYYEAKKYVPFDLKDVDFVYQPVAFAENKQRRWRIILYAVRKQTVEKYDRILKQIGCKPFVYEPSPVSLIKELIARNDLKPDQNIAVVYVQQRHGQIIFYEKGSSYFVREFFLPVPEGNDPQAAVHSMRTSLFSEIKKSFQYYNRQFSQQKIEEALVLSDAADEKLGGILMEELSVKARTVDSSVVAGQQTLRGLEIMCACGVCLTNVPSALTSFNFLQKKGISQSSTAVLSWDLKELWPALHTAVIGVLVLAGAFVFGQLKLRDIHQQLDRVVLRQGSFANTPLEDIQTRIKANKDDLNGYKNIPLHTHMASLLVKVTKALPDGVWLKELNIHYGQSDRVVLSLDGYVYSADTEAQFKIVNELLSNLKAQKSFSSQDLQVTTMQRQKLHNRQVVYFQIKTS